MTLRFINKDTGCIKEAVFCFTGKAHFTRRTMEKVAIKAGAQITKTVNNRTTILVIADVNSQSTKAQKARSLGLDLINPNQFMAMCSSNNIPETNGDSPISSFFIENPKPIVKPKQIETPIPVKKHDKKKRYSNSRRIEL